jgi:two-component sensor histidine kinase
MLSRSSWAPVPVHELAGQIIHAALQAVPWRQAAVVTVKPGAEKVSPRQAGALAMVINELATNSVKYGNPAGGAVTIGFEAESDQEGMTLRYRDNGPGYPPEVLAQERSNIGLKLIHELVKGTLGGQVTIANDHGAVTTLRIRLEEETRT